MTITEMNFINLCFIGLVNFPVICLLDFPGKLRYIEYGRKDIKMKLKIVLEKGKNGYIVAHVPALKGCWSQGKTKVETLKNIKEAILLYLEPDPQEVRPARNHQVLELAL